MQVDPATANHRRHDRPQREPSLRDTAFARAVTSRRPDDTPAPTGVETFAALVEIGDPAVRFDGRAIVAPVAEDSLATGAERLAEAQVAEYISPVDVASIPATLAQAVRHSTARAIQQEVDTAAVGTARQLAPNVTSAPGRPALSPAPEWQRMPNDAPTKQPVARAAAASRPAAPAVQPHAIARTVVFADEVRVLVRGNLLTTDERAELIRVAHDTLAGTPLADRPVRLIETRGRG